MVRLSGKCHVCVNMAQHQTDTEVSIVSAEVNIYISILKTT